MVTHSLRATPRSSSTRPRATWLARVARRRQLAGELARYLGAVSILIVGAVHAQQYYDAYF